jgi:hypothetical protein
MESIRAAIFEALEADQPMTVRQVFYRLTSQGVIPKAEGEYNATVVRLLGEMRRDGTIPYEWLADATRWMRKPTTYSSVEEAASQHRQDLPPRSLERRLGVRRDLVGEGGARRRLGRCDRSVGRAADGDPRL